jgi:hypothetical protein
MAIDPSTEFPGKITAPDVNYTYGSAKAVTTPTSQDGTPWSLKLVNDILGFQQALLNVTSIVPSGNAETQLASQYLSALNEIITEQNFGEDVLNTDAYVVTTKSRATKYIVGLYFLKVTNTNTGAVTVNFDSLGVKNVKRRDGLALVANDLRAGLIIPMVYNGTEMRLLQADEKVRDLGRDLTIEPGGDVDEEITIEFAERVLQNTDGVSRKLGATGPVTVNNTAIGALGKFGVALSVDTWYSIWCVNGSSGTTFGLHTSDDLATVLAAAPAGYQEYGSLLGWIPTDATSDFAPIRQINEHVEYTNHRTIKNGSFSTGAWTGVTVSTIFPVGFARRVICHGGSVNGTIFGLAGLPTGLRGSYFTAGNSGTPSNFGGRLPLAIEVGSNLQVPLISTQLFYFVDIATSALLGVGWEY